VAHPIPPQAPAVGHSSGADHRAKSALQIGRSPAVSKEVEEESDDGTDVDSYFNMTMFSTQPV
jgi:hypothetical protein